MVEISSSTRLVAHGFTLALRDLFSCHHLETVYSLRRGLGTGRVPQQTVIPRRNTELQEACLDR